MTRPAVGIVAILTLLFVTLAPAWAAEPKGTFGLTVDVDADGFFLNPTLKSVTVQKVEPKSPAANAGIAAGDQIVEAEGRAVAGAKARELQPILSKQPGQTIHLLLKRLKGETYKVTMTAVARPR
jgi:C-terminal processing protease CtpA/Prc